MSYPDENEPWPVKADNNTTKFVGLVTMKPLDADSLVLPEHFTLPFAATLPTLTVELAHTFLPVAWGKRYATESVRAVFELCKRAQGYWAPFAKLYIRAFVNEDNSASLRVMEKTCMTKTGVFEFTRKPIYLAGAWRERHRLYIPYAVVIAPIT